MNRRQTWMPQAQAPVTVGPLGLWLRDHLMPLWLARLNPAAGLVGYPQWLDANGFSQWPEPPRMLPQARLVYVLAHAALLGCSAARLSADQALETLNQHFWWDDWQGWRMGIARDQHEVLDTYDQAFGLFALAWMHRLTGSDALRQRALLVLTALERRQHGAGGYPEQVGPRISSQPLSSQAVRRQNPHMHLLEALLAWHETDPAGPWLSAASALVDLAQQHFIDPSNGSLREFLNEELAAAPAEAGVWREPGHQFEWVWLLWLHAQAKQQSFPDSMAERLMQFGRGAGSGSDSRMIDVVSTDGQPLDTCARLWPQTEWLKAELAIATSQTGHFDRALQAWGVIARQYLNPADTSRWHNRLDSQGTPIEPLMPVRVLYHLFLATAEADRLFPEPLAQQAFAMLPEA